MAPDDTTAADSRDPKALWESLPEEERSALRDREAARLFAVAAEAQRNNDPEAAVKGYSRALALNPRLAEAYNNLGVVLRATNRAEAAVACYRRAIALRPRNANSYSNLGNVLRDLGRVEAAVASHQQAVHLAPQSPDALLNLGIALRDLGRHEMAEDCFTRAIALAPDHAGCRLDQARSRLLVGDYEAGFAGLEARFDLPGYSLRGTNMPRWDGADLKGKTVLVQSEGTAGDVIQFARYLPMIKERGGNVVLETPGGLADLMATVDGVTKVVRTGADLPHFDLHIPLLSLPGVFGTTADSVPTAGTYIRPPDPGAYKLAQRTEGAKGTARIGIAWADERAGGGRTTPGLRPFMELAGVPGVALYSLQRGAAATDLSAVSCDALVFDAARRTRDLSGLAAVIDQLDLVVTVDSPVAHLAGALGKPVWIIAPASPDWRWGLAEEATPWYPTARVLRTDRRGDWDGLFEQARRGLRAFAAANNG